MSSRRGVARPSTLARRLHERYSIGASSHNDERADNLIEHDVQHHYHHDMLR
jgi:hypothetical protein